MTDLTEKWKKGKIPEAWYYVKDIHNKESLDRYFKETDNFEYLEDWEVDEVLAEVPSYEEWQKRRKTLLKTQEKNCDLEIKNKQLKELLKECRDEIEYLRNHYKGRIDHFKNNTRLDKEINQVLGEE